MFCFNLGLPLLVFYFLISFLAEPEGNWSLAAYLTWFVPAGTIVIAILIFWQTWGLLRETVEMSLSAVPRGIEFDHVDEALCGLPGVSEIHDLHIWPMSTTETALTAHLVIPEGHPGDAFLYRLAHELEHDFRIGHVTIQVETEAESDCALAGEAVV